MNAAYQPYIEGVIFTGNLKADIENFLRFHNEHDTYIHTVAVAAEARKIAVLFHTEPELAEQAGLLHDVSNVVPGTKMMTIAASQSIELLEEEGRYPRIVHQKLSKDMAQHIFGCTNELVLQAIECHTTLKPKASQLDKILFAADKISWNIPGEHPYQAAMREKLDAGDLDGAVLIYLHHVWEQRDKLKLVHPWLIGAREELMRSGV